MDKIQELLNDIIHEAQEVGYWSGDGEIDRQEASRHNKALTEFKDELLRIIRDYHVRL